MDVLKICPVAPEGWHTKGQAKKIASTARSTVDNTTYMGEYLFSGRREDQMSITCEV
jgi:hypothetical protein